MSGGHKAGRVATPGDARTAPSNPALRHVLTHLITPLLMCLGMGLTYLGAFATPSRTTCRSRSSGRAPRPRCSRRR